MLINIDRIYVSESNPNVIGHGYSFQSNGEKQLPVTGSYTVTKATRQVIVLSNRTKTGTRNQPTVSIVRVNPKTGEIVFNISATVQNMILAS